MHEKFDHPDGEEFYPQHILTSAFIRVKGRETTSLVSLRLDDWERMVGMGALDYVYLPLGVPKTVYVSHGQWQV
jgi:hypothetical protein